MLDTKLEKTGTILMHEGRIYIAGYHADNCMCREVAIHACLHAIGELQKEIETVIKEGGSGKSCIGLPKEVYEALNLDPWEY